MAITEPEPKKIGIAVTSISSSENILKKLVRAFRALRTLKSVTLSSTLIKYYNIFQGIKFCTFYIPKCLSDPRIDIFIDTCWEQLFIKNHRLQTSERWEYIASFCFKKPKDSFLFILRDCIELIEATKEFACSRVTYLGGNYIFRSLYNNILHLLPHLPPKSIVNNTLRTESHLFDKNINDCHIQERRRHFFEDIIDAIINKNIFCVKVGNQSIWKWQSKKEYVFMLEHIVFREVLSLSWRRKKIPL